MTRRSMVISVAIHVAVFLVLIIAPMAELREPRQRFVPIDISAIPEPVEQPEPETPDPEPEPEPEKPEISEELITDLQEQVQTPKPTPTKKPTVKPTPKPTRVPTKRPTPRPTLTPMPTSTPLPTLVPTVPYQVPLSDEVFNQRDEEETSNAFTITGESGTDYDFNPYASLLRTLLQRAWDYRTLQNQRPEPREYITMVSFTVMRDGSIYDVMIEDSSGWERMDKSVGEAVMKIDQDAPLPADYTANRIRVRFPFILTLPENQRP